MRGAAEWAPDADAASLRTRPACMSEAEFHDFYQQTARGLKAYLLRMTSNHAQSDDLLQESYLRLLRATLPTLDFNSRKSYLFRIATNLARDSFRRRRFEPQPLDDRRAHAAAPRDPSLATDVERILAQASGRERELLWLAYVEGASHREIAEITGLGEASVRPLLYRARNKLAALLRECGWCQPTKGASR